VNGTEDISVIGHGHGGHAECFDALTKFFDVASAIEKGVIGMEVQVNELGLGARSHFLEVILALGSF
jgi:hypothetical protein